MTSLSGGNEIGKASNGVGLAILSNERCGNRSTVRSKRQNRATSRSGNGERIGVNNVLNVVRSAGSDASGASNGTKDDRIASLCTMLRHSNNIASIGKRNRFLNDARKSVAS